jgi:hypothetical protein
LSPVYPFRAVTIGLALFASLTANGWCGQSAIYLHPANLIGGQFIHATWLAATGEWAVNPRISIVATPVSLRRSFTETGHAMFGDYRAEHDDTHYGLYLGPRLYLDSHGYFYTQASMAWHSFDSRGDLDGKVSTYVAKILGGFAYLGLKLPGKRIALTLDMGLGRKFMEYDREKTGHTQTRFAYIGGGIAVDINLCMGFNLGPPA